MTKPDIKVGLVDDHILLRNALSKNVESFEGFTVSILAGNGKEFIDKLNSANKPEIILLDLNMPVMDGYETIRWLNKNHPEIKIIVVSMFDPESLLHLIKQGIRGFIKKDMDPREFRDALQSVIDNGIFCSQVVTGRLFNLLMNQGTPNSVWGSVILNDNEIVFLKHASTELTYKEIAEKMKISPRTVDNYRDSLFLKLNVKSRVGLAMYALKNGIASMQY